MKYCFVSIELCPENNFYSIITLERIPDVISWLFGKKSETEHFRGNCTVWHNIETGLRAGCTGNALHDFVIGSTLMEGFLFNIWNKYRTQSTGEGKMEKQFVVDDHRVGELDAMQIAKNYLQDGIRESVVVRKLLAAGFSEDSASAIMMEALRKLHAEKEKSERDEFSRLLRNL